MSHRSLALAALGKRSSMTCTSTVRLAKWISACDAIEQAVAATIGLALGRKLKRTFSPRNLQVQQANSWSLLTFLLVESISRHLRELFKSLVFPSEAQLPTQRNVYKKATSVTAATLLPTLVSGPAITAMKASVASATTASIRISAVSILSFRLLTDRSLQSLLPHRISLAMTLI
jgi:hypothetical protein